MISRHTKDAQLVWRQLNGIISVFKPAGVKTTQVKYSVISNLVRGKIYDKRLNIWPM